MPMRMRRVRFVPVPDRKDKPVLNPASPQRWKLPEDPMPVDPRPRPREDRDQKGY